MPEADIPRWSGMIHSALERHDHGRAVRRHRAQKSALWPDGGQGAGDKYGNAGAVKLALVGQTFFSALSAFAPFGFVGDPTLAATLLLFTRIGGSEPRGGSVATALVSAMLYPFPDLQPAPAPNSL